MDKEHWARLVNRKPKQNDAAIVPTASSSTTGGSNDLVPEGYHVPREHFVPPVPGKNGAVAGVLEGKTLVLTGIFPEVGGGRGLTLGTAKVKAMIELFGGRMTGSVSGRTDILVVGKEPGQSKVTAAEASTKCVLISLKGLKDVFEGASLEQVASKPLFIPTFSAGYPKAKAIKADPASGPVLVKNNVGFDADKKPAAKRKKLEVGGAKKPAAKKRKAKKAPAPKKKLSKAKAVEEKENANDDGNVSDDQEEESFEITCDECKVDCSDQSWYVMETKEDFCADCRDGRGVPQRFGLDL